MLRALFFYHYLLWFAYYFYTQSSRSDSFRYYADTMMSDSGWFDHFGTSTTFVSFIAYPFTQYGNFTYEAQMIWFAFFGYLGFVFFYIFLKEHIKFRHEIWGIPLITLILFLPNNHFWSVSLGKGSTIFFGLGLFFYSLGNLRSRLLPAIVGGVIIYYVRPHIMFVILIGLAVGLFSTSKNLNTGIRVLAIGATGLLLVSLYEEILLFTGLETNFFEESTTLSHRANELSKASSGVDIQSYSVPYQLFTFWFRPLFFDAPGILGLFVSIENLIYLLIILNFVRLDFLSFLWKGDYLVKTTFLTFVLASYPLAQVAGNLGLAIRQKAMVMILLFFLILYYLDHKKMNAYKTYVYQIWKSKVKMSTGENE